ncbi:MAG: hypothetical protein LQ348_003039, partial [Seirophora lacunosa]
MYPLESRNGGIDGSGKELVEVAIGCACAALLTAVARFVSRGFYAQGFGFDDWTIAVSTLCAIGLAFWASQILYELTVNLTKLSILFLYLRVFPPLQNPRFTRAVVAVMRFIALYMFISIVVTIFQCNPIRKAWDRYSTPAGRCIDLTAFWYANSISNIGSAALTLGLPVKMIWNLQLPRGDKVGLYMVFGLGI